MKSSILFLALVATLAFASCEKSTTDPETNELNGTWNLVKVTGGFSGAGYTAKFDKLQFTGTNMVMTFSKAIVDTRPYSINSKGDTLSFNEGNATAESFFTAPKKTITLEKEKLILSDPCCDLFNYEFSKSNN